MKGQKSRSGVAIKGFEGGQMPLYMRLPKIGFHNKFAKRFAVLTVADLNRFHKAGRLPKGELDPKALLESKIITRAFDGIRIIGNDKAIGAWELTVHSASKGAKAAIENGGGRLTLTAPPKKPKEPKEPKGEAKGEAKTKAKPIGETAKQDDKKDGTSATKEPTRGE